MSRPRFARILGRQARGHRQNVPCASLWGPGGLVAQDVSAAVTPLSRARGLLGRASLGASEAILIRPCAQVHTLGMRFAIDAVFCDRELQVLHVVTLRPRRVSRHVRRAACCFELAAGRASECGIVPGTRLELRRTSS